MKRSIALLCFALILSLITVTQAQETINISFSCTCSELQQAWLNEFVFPTYIAQQAEKGKDVFVELIVYDLSGEEYRELLSVEFNSEAGADISSFDGFWIAEFAEAGLLKPLTEVVDEEVLDWDGWEQLGVLGNVSYNSELYGVPEGTDVRVIYYRTDLFETAGIEMPWQPQSWQDVLDTAQTLKDAGIEVPLQLDAGLYMGEATTMQGYFMLLLGAGAHIYDFDNNVWVIDEAAHLNALNFYKTVYVDEGLGNLDFQLHEDGRAETFAAMHDGQIGMYIEGDWMWRAIMNPNHPEFGIADRDELVAWAAMPAMEAGAGYRGQDFVTISGGNGFVLNPNTAYPQEAWELLAVMASQEAGQARQNYETRVLARLDVDITGDPILESMVEELLPLSTNRPLLADYPVISTEMQYMTELVITGEATPEEALAEFISAVQGIVGEENLVIISAE